MGGSFLFMQPFNSNFIKNNRVFFFTGLWTTQSFVSKNPNEFLRIFFNLLFTMASNFYLRRVAS